MDIKGCVSCGSTEVARFRGRTSTVSHHGFTIQVHKLSGIECKDENCREIVYSGASAERYSEACDTTVQMYRASEILRIRKKLGLTQKQMVSAISGGGHNAISRYEKAEVPIPTPLWVLIGLLDRHPELINELNVKAA